MLDKDESTTASGNRPVDVRSTVNIKHPGTVSFGAKVVDQKSGIVLYEVDGYGDRQSAVKAILVAFCVLLLAVGGIVLYG